LLLAGALSLALPAGPTHARSAGAKPAADPGAEPHPSGASGHQPSGATARTSAEATEEAKAALREMGTRLASATTLQFKVRSLIPMKGPGGEWITIVGQAGVMREGRDKLFVGTGGDLFAFDLIFDGKTVTAFSAAKKIYAQREAPGTIDAMLERAAKDGEAAFVFADLVSADPYAAMTRGLQSARVVGTSTVDGIETEHLAVHGQKLDWEIWIGTHDRLPRLVTLTDISEARKPTQTVQLSDWTLNQAIPPDAFSFNAPADAMKVPFHSPGQLKAAARRGPQPAGRP
jgi:hypothetical protein